MWKQVYFEHIIQFSLGDKFLYGASGSGLGGQNYISEKFYLSGIMYNSSIRFRYAF